jgi:CubicO group peptidase (beta-lactamase class C family)
MRPLLPLLLLPALACQPDADVRDTGPGETGDTGWEPRFDALVEAVLADLEASHAPGVSVAVLEDGVITFAAAFGSGHPDQQVDITADTLFQIGSDTKKQTAVALLQKVEQGLVSMDDTLATALPDLEFAYGPEWNDQVTLHHLLSHQGAFYDYAIWEPGEDDALLASWTYGTFAQQWFLMNPPGAFWNYSNPNFSLAGLVTEENDSRAWPDLMREDLYLPLGMERTFLRKAEVIADGDYAVGYGIDPATGAMATREMETVTDHAWTRPAGLAWSTASEHLLFARFLMEGDPAVLSDELREEMFAEQVNTLYLDDELHYGYGLMVQRGRELDGAFYRVPVWSHGGNTLAFTSLLEVLPEQGYAIAILSSGYGTDFSASADAAIRSLVLEDLPEPVDPPAYVIDTERFALHVGAYNDPWNVGPATVTQVGDSLHIDLPVLDQYGYDYEPELIALSSDIHYIEIDGYYYDLTFIPVAEGEPSTYIRNRSFVLSRVEEDEGTRGAPRTPSREDVARFLERAKVMGPLPDAVKLRR